MWAWEAWRTKFVSKGSGGDNSIMILRQKSDLRFQKIIVPKKYKNKVKDFGLQFSKSGLFVTSDP